MRDNRGRRKGGTIAERIAGARLRLNALFAFGLVALFGLSFQIGRALYPFVVGQVATESTTQLLFDFVNDPWGALLFVVGVAGIIILGLAVAFHWIKANGRHLAGGFIVLFALTVVGFLIASNVTPTSGSLTTAPSSATLVGYIVTSALQPGCSVNTITSTQTCDVVYNYTSNYFATSASNATTCNWYGGAGGHCHPFNYINVAVHEARTDSLNTTYGFNFVIGVIPTVTTTGANPTVYSPVTGYIAATSTATGYWLIKQSAGSLNGLNPPQSAPGTTSGVGTSTVGITAFGSVTDTWNDTLPGASSSSAPTGLYAALTLYGSYSETFQVSNASPATYTLTIIVIGEHA